MYVIKRTEDGKYVTNPGSEQSYTSKLEHARVFTNRAVAERECCGDERIMRVKDVMERPR